MATIKRRRESSTKAFDALAIMATILSLLFVPLLMVAFYEPFYFDSFKEREVALRLGISQDSLEQEFSSLLRFIDGAKIDLPETFSEREGAHFQDVRSIFSAIKEVLAFCIIYLVWYIGIIRKNLFALASILNLGILGLLAIASLMDFMSLFIAMHKLLFTNDLWWVYETDWIYAMVPENVFYTLALRWYALSGALSILLQVVARQRK